MLAGPLDDLGLHRCDQPAVAALLADLDPDDRSPVAGRWRVWMFRAGRKPPSPIFITRASGSVVETRASLTRSRRPLPSFFRCCSLIASSAGSACQRPLDPIEPLTRRPLTRHLLLATRARLGCIGRLPLRGQPLDLLARLAPGTAPGSAADGTSPTPAAARTRTPSWATRLSVTSSSLISSADRLGQQLVQLLLVRHPKVRQQVVVDRHPAPQPPIHVVLLGQPGQPTGTPDPLHRRQHPQPQQHLRIARRPPWPIHRRPNPGVERPQLQPLHHRPDRPRRMVHLPPDPPGSAAPARSGPAPLARSAARALPPTGFGRTSCCSGIPGNCWWLAHRSSSHRGCLILPHHPLAPVEGTRRILAPPAPPTPPTTPSPSIAPKRSQAFRMTGGMASSSARDDGVNQRPSASAWTSTNGLAVAGRLWCRGGGSRRPAPRPR